MVWCWWNETELLVAVKTFPLDPHDRLHPSEYCVALSKLLPYPMVPVSHAVYATVARLSAQGRSLVRKWPSLPLVTFPGGLTTFPLDVAFANARGHSNSISGLFARRELEPGRPIKLRIR